MLTRALIEGCFIEACRLDVEAIKPGNVSTSSPGHGMQAEDFLVSARVAAPHLADATLGVGARVLRATRATWDAVHCNTNIGILLLCAPLAAAAGASVEDILAALDIGDAAQVYEALRLASPAGLGQSSEHDVSEVPRVGLRAAMAAAAGRDCIARQYANGFQEVLTLGVPCLRRALDRGVEPAAAMSEVFLMYLMLAPDTHVARKHGIETARALWQEACARQVQAGDREALMAWDADLKRRGINPGTSADLSVAAWFAMRMEAARKSG